MATVKPEYYLNVDFAVAEGATAKFEDLMGKLLLPGGVFARTGWSLVLALRSIEVYPLRPDEIVNDGSQDTVDDRSTTPYYEAFDTQLLSDVDPKDARYKRYVHVWRLPEPNGVADVMRTLGDDDTYIALDGLVEREVQELLFCNPAPQLPSLPTAPP